MPTLLSRCVCGVRGGGLIIWYMYFFFSFYFVWLNETVHAILALAHRGAAKGSDEPLHTCSFTRAFAALIHKVRK